jgi:hypothetical protein
VASIRVPQTDGEITIATGGDPGKTYKVKDHVVTVAKADVPLFLSVIDGSRPATKDDAPDEEPDPTDAPAVSPT